MTANRQTSENSAAITSVADTHVAKPDVAACTRQSLMMERIREIQARVASMPSTGLEADKEFYDSLNDE